MTRPPSVYTLRPGINGRSKGSNYERKVAKLFETWWGKKVSRTPLSGGWGNNTLFDTQGDLICAGGWPYTVECKAQESWHLEQLIANEKCVIKDWWDQACVQARGVARPGDKKPPKRKAPLLVFTRNHQPSYVMIRKDDFHKFSPYWTPLGSMMEMVIETQRAVNTVYVLLLKDFFRHVRPPKPSPNHEYKRTAFSGIKLKSRME